MAKRTKTAIAQDAVEQLLEATDLEVPVKKPEGETKELSLLINERLKLKASDEPRVRIQAYAVLGRIKTAAIRLVYGKADPTTVPQKYIRHALEEPIFNHVANIAGRKTIGNPGRGIRVFCLECQGGDTDASDAVRNCAAINCQLWAFRMGTNPFHSRLSAEDSDAESTETEADIAEMEAEHAV